MTLFLVLFLSRSQAEMCANFVLRCQPNCRGKEALIAIVTAICNLHGNNVAHLDLKTPNVLIAADGSVKVADVGLGKLVMGNRDIKLSHTGTYIWAAPEQLHYEGSLASDMFALSTIIHEVRQPHHP